MTFLIEPKLYSFYEISYKCSNDCGAQCLDIDFREREE